MKTKPIDNVASIRQRLLNIARENGEDFQQLLTRYANERFLYRLSISEHRKKLLLKGASLFTLWFGVPHRQTKDIDFLGFGSNEIEDVEKMIRDICQIPCDDGLLFDPRSTKGGEIKEGEEYQGVRISFIAKLGNARIILQTDVGFGDAVNPEPETVDFPTLLDQSVPRLKAYPKETVVGEKFEAMVKLGIANSRMKDFWDLNWMIREFEFDGEVLQRAIVSTFERRKTPIPTQLPLALTPEFAIDQSKLAQWKAFVRRNGLGENLTLDVVISNLATFLSPIIEATATSKIFKADWKDPNWTRKGN